MQANRTKDELMLLQDIEDYLSRVAYEGMEDENLDMNLLTNIGKFIKSLYTQHASPKSADLKNDLDVIIKWKGENTGHLYSLDMYDHESIYIVSELINKVLGREMKYIGNVKLKIESND